MKTETRRCQNCKKKMTDVEYYYNRKFCSDSCGKAYRRKNKRGNDVFILKKPCQYENEVCREIATSILNTKFYCTKHFQIKRRQNAGEKLNCLECGKLFEKSDFARLKKFCSYTCRLQYRKREAKK